MKPEKMYGFVEFHRAVDADIAMSMDGIGLMGRQLSIRRPSNYTPDPGAVSKKWIIPGALSTQVPEGPHKIFLGSLPPTMTEEESQQLASAFGELQAFTLSKDMSTGLNKGYAFFCYKDTSLTNIACAGLDGQVIGGNRLVCRPANQKGGTTNAQGMLPTAGMGALLGAASAGIAIPGLNGLTANIPLLNMGMGMGMGQLGALGGQFAAAAAMAAAQAGGVEQATRFLKMENMVTAEELSVEEEYQDILDDVTEECKKHGPVLRVEIPKPGAADCGTIFVVYESTEGAKEARSKLDGRKFNERTIVISFLQQEEFNAKF